MRHIVKIFAICLTIFGVQVARSAALTMGSNGLKCKNLFIRSSANRPLLKKRVENLLDAGRWLRANAHSVDPQTTHMQQFESLVFEIQKRIDEVLPTKKSEKNYAVYEPLLRGIIKEIEHRIAIKKVTYEWVSGLPYRIGFLLKMDGTKPMFLRLGVDPVFMFDPLSYATHENFLHLLTKATEEAAARVHFSRSVIASLAKALKNFPQQRMLPLFGGINVRELNHLVADESWPIGLTVKPKHVDSLLHDEFAFPLHDMAHATLRYEHLYKEQIPPEVINSIERDVLEQIEKSPLSEQDFNVQQYLHFVLFHEGMATDFTLRKNGQWTEELTPQTMKEGVTHALVSMDDFLIHRSEGIPHLFDDLRKTAEFSSEKEAEESVKRNILNYAKKVELAVDRQMP